MRAPSSCIDGLWFSYLYSHNLLQDQVEGLALGTTMPNLNTSILHRLCVAFPSINEQHEIANRLDYVRKKLSTELQYKQKLVLAKNGLMQNLLTGKVRVKPD